MSIHEGTMKLDILDAEYEDSKKDRLERHEDDVKHRIERQVGNIKWLMNEQRGRELMWDFIIDAGSLKLNPYTRNADTYYILGLQRQAKLCIEILKSLDFELYQLMEKEANNRQRREDSTDG